MHWDGDKKHSLSTLVTRIQQVLDGWMGFGGQIITQVQFHMNRKIMYTKVSSNFARHDCLPTACVFCFPGFYPRILGDFLRISPSESVGFSYPEVKRQSGQAIVAISLPTYEPHLLPLFLADSLPRCWTSSSMSIEIGQVHGPVAREVSWILGLFRFVFCLSNAAVQRKYLPMAGSVVEAKVSFWLFLKWFLLVRVQKASICMI